MHPPPVGPPNRPFTGWRNDWFVIPLGRPPNRPFTDWRNACPATQGGSALMKCSTRAVGEARPTGRPSLCEAPAQARTSWVRNSREQNYTLPQALKDNRCHLLTAQPSEKFPPDAAGVTRRSRPRRLWLWKRSLRTGGSCCGIRRRTL